MDETTFYSDAHGVRITSARAVIGSRTYSMANVSSVGIGIVKGRRFGAAMLVLAGLLLTLGLASSGSGIVFGLGTVGIGCLWYYVAGPRFAVRINAAGGETDALISKDKAYAEQIVSALNEAFVKRG